MERWNGVQGQMLSKTGPRDTWSERIVSTNVTYNGTTHGTTTFPPAVVLYSFLCSDLDEVPEEYRDILARALRKYRDWKSMSVFVQKTTSVSLDDFSTFGNDIAPHFVLPLHSLYFPGELEESCGAFYQNLRSPPNTDGHRCRCPLSASLSRRPCR